MPRVVRALGVDVVHVGDTFITRWEIAELTLKPRFDVGDIVVFEGTGMTEEATTAVTARSVLAVGETAPWNPAEHVRAAR